jgi:phosphoribosyl 1,2-cyclic phosphodiesterase
VSYGHATVEATVDLAVRAGVSRLVLFHHGPDRTDDQVTAIADSSRARAGSSGPTVEAATEGSVIALADS